MRPAEAVGHCVTCASLAGQEGSRDCGEARTGWVPPELRSCRPRRISHSSGFLRTVAGAPATARAARPRLIHFLPTHLFLPEVTDRLFLSRPSDKTHVASIYGKLGVQTRSEAVDSIDQLGLGPMRAAESQSRLEIAAETAKRLASSRSRAISAYSADDGSLAAGVASSHCQQPANAGLEVGR
jgi:hypothetical protein